MNKQKRKGNLPYFGIHIGVTMEIHSYVSLYDNQPSGGEGTGALVDVLVKWKTRWNLLFKV